MPRTSMPKTKYIVSILTTRFTSETFAENKRYRENKQLDCVYSTSLPISDKLPYKDYYVLEMNNTTNKIIGIGKISKKLQPTAQIYSYKYYNRYTYIGTEYASMDALNTNEESHINEESETLESDSSTETNESNEELKIKQIIYRIEKKIFYGKGHLKRGSSYTSFPAYPHAEDVNDLISVFNYITRHKLIQ